MRATIALLLVACASPQEPETHGGGEDVQDVDPSRTEGCAQTHLAFDLRALPTGASFELWVVGEADDLRRVAVGPTPRVYGQLGASTLDVKFDAATESEALDHCRATLAAYLPNAPRYPLAVDGRFESATQASPCAPCGATAPNDRNDPARAPGECPASYGQDAPSCEGEGAAMECDYPEGRCSCGTPVWCGGAAPPPMPVSWMCRPHRSPCAAAGSSCDEEGANCSTDACGWSGVRCTNGTWSPFRTPPPP